MCLTPPWRSLGGDANSYMNEPRMRFHVEIQCVEFTLISKFKIMKYILFLIIVSVNLLCSAQNNEFIKCYDTDISVIDTDVDIFMPEGFSPLNTPGSDILIVNPDYKPRNAISSEQRVISLHPVVLESADKECALLYPTLSLRIQCLDNIPTREIQAIAENEDLDVSGNIRMISLDDMTEWCNADTAFIYELKLPKPYIGKYRNCIGVYLRKYAHPAALIKVMITDNGLKNKDHYLKALLNSIHYGDNITTEAKKWVKILQEFKTSDNK